MGICKIWVLASLTVCMQLAAQPKVVLISGANGGIGQATVQAFEKKGWNVWAGYRSSVPEHLQTSSQIRWIPLDVTDEQQVQQAVQTVLQEEGRIDALINNAGYGIIGFESQVKMEEALKLFDVNFFGSLRLIQAVASQMQTQGFGHIINISSTSGVRAVPGLGLYAASKFALEGLSEALAVTLSPWNIQVALVEPGTVKNDFAPHCVTSTASTKTPFAERFCLNLKNKLISLALEGQECAEIGQLIVKVAETAKPHLRYQTSAKVEETVAKKYVDLTGDKLRDEQIRFFQTLIE